MAFRDFLRGTFKIALAIFLAVLALVAVGWGVLTYKQRNEQLEAQAYEVVRSWRKENLKEFLQLDLFAKTKLVDGRLQVAVQLQGYPPYLSHPRLRDRNKDAQIIIGFEDADGFKLYEKGLKLSEFSTTVDAKGGKIGLDHQFEDYLGLTKYKSFSRLAVQWTLETNIPPEPKVATVPTPKPTVMNETDDHCAPGLTKQDRLRRLAKHGTVRQTRENSYAVGLREVTFYSERIGGAMLACR